MGIRENLNTLCNWTRIDDDKFYDMVMKDGCWSIIRRNDSKTVANDCKNHVAEDDKGCRLPTQWEWDGGVEVKELSGSQSSFHSGLDDLGLSDDKIQDIWGVFLAAF